MTTRQVFVACALALALGCATASAPNEAVSNAEYAIRKAEEREATAYAPLEMRIAKDKIEQSRLSMAAGDNEHAQRLAEQAAVDAQLAEAKARAGRAEATVAEIEKSIEALRSETERRPLEVQ
jgi:hypothetical protein